MAGLMHFFTDAVDCPLFTGFANVRQKLYLCGGVSRSNTVFVNTVQSFDIIGMKWENEAPLPVPLHSCAAAGAGGSLYVSGGFEVHHGNATCKMHMLTPGESLQYAHIANRKELCTKEI